MQTVSDWKRLKTNKSYATKKSFTISASDEPGFQKMLEEVSRNFGFKDISPSNKKNITKDG